MFLHVAEASRMSEVSDVCLVWFTGTQQSHVLYAWG